jgi:alkanesulfonate monooxygenase SsuD/methylene tetrahydromethanopterin reductase-like flavin-dependent oxidoreductase (luciferase family)
MTPGPERNSTAGRRGRLVLGVTVRTLGAWPGGWRSPGAHRDPRHDRAALRAIAADAEAAGLHFLFFGDWLATGAEFEHTDPSLLARVEPFTAISYLAAVTERIGLIATASSAHSEPYAAARAIASVDLLSEGRVALSVATGTEPRTARNFGSAPAYDDDRYASAAEFIHIVRGLWDSWADDAFVSDADTGQLIDRSRLNSLDYSGRYRSSAGPLNTVRPPQGHPPVAVVVTAPASRDLAVQEADIAFVSPKTLDEGIASAAALRQQVVRAGRPARDLVLVAPILPIVADTQEHAWEAYDRLVDLVLLAEPTGATGPSDATSATGATEPTGATGAAEAVVAAQPAGAAGANARGAAAASGIPAGRDTRAVAGILGVPLAGIALDDAVPVRTAARFGVLGQELIAEVALRAGRTVGGVRPLTFRHLLVAHLVAAPVVVGSAHHIADHIETWFEAGAVDGFTVLPAFIGEQFDLFLSLVVPELRRRGLLPDDDEGADDTAATDSAPITLRQRLGLGVPSNRHDLPIDSFSI